MERATRSEYQELVNALMLLGWYRTGEEPPERSDDPMWGFRRGHLTDTAPEKTLWVPAATELDAMRDLLSQLRQAEAGSRLSRKP